MGGVIFQRFILYMQSIQLGKNLQFIFTFLINTDHVHIMTDCMQIILLKFYISFVYTGKKFEKISRLIFVGFLSQLDSLYNHLTE